MSGEISGVIVIDLTDDGEDRILFSLQAPVTAVGVWLAQSWGDGPVPSHTHIVSVTNSP